MAPHLSLTERKGKKGNKAWCVAHRQAGTPSPVVLPGEGWGSRAAVGGARGSGAMLAAGAAAFAYPTTGQTSGIA